MKKNILQYLERNAIEYPDKLAYSDLDAGYTWSKLYESSRHVGSYVADKLEYGSAVLVYMKKSADCFPAFFGAVYGGCFFVPIDDRMPADRINIIIGIVNPGLVIYDDKTKKNIDKLNCDCAKEHVSSVLEYPVSEEALDRIRDKMIDTDPLYVLFTSGSTGIPKGVVVCHRSVIDYAEWVCDRFSLSSDTIFGNQTPFYFSMSVLDIYSNLCAGSTLYIIPKMLFSFPVRLIEVLNDKKINTIYWVPSALSIVANLGTFEEICPKYLKTILFAGEVMPTKQLNIWRKNIPDAIYANLFGPTEITDIGIYYILDREFSDDEPIPIGYACDNVDMLVIAEDGKIITSDNPNALGELYIRGSFLAHGYYKNPAKTAEAFVQNPVNDNYPELVYKTGDLVYYNTRGELVYSSRKDFQIKHMGNRIELGEIEAALSAQDGVDVCCCLYDSQNDFIVAVFSGNAQEENLRENMGQKVPTYMLPNVYMKLDNIPLNANGKIDRLYLKKTYEDNK